MTSPPLAGPVPFPRAGRFCLQTGLKTVCEAPASFFPWSERHIQAVWYDDRLRPAGLKTRNGEPVTVEQPGRWNLVAGPDFSGAVVCVGREKRRMAGDVEVHISPADWKQHGHAKDPRYRNVRVHVTWFPGPADDSLFPPGTVHIALAPVCTADLESIDPSAYPYAEPGARPALLNDPPSDPDLMTSFLEDAGEERLRRKTVRLLSLMQKRGREQIFYEETAAALGYQHNKAPFRRLAQALPLAALQAHYGGDAQTVYAVLAGVSGLLPRQPGARWTAAARTELRRVWDVWWREAHRWEEAGELEAGAWRLGGIRPLNHPLRRMAALAQWVAGGVFQSMAGPEPFFVQDLCRFQPCFWSSHASWGGVARRADLVGKERARAVLINVVVPGRLAGGDVSAMAQLPAEPLNHVIRETACLLFGPDHSPSLYRSALARQGLLLLFDEFVLTGRPLRLNGPDHDKQLNHEGETWNMPVRSQWKQKER